MIELPQQDPCEICETVAGRGIVPVVAKSEWTLTVVIPVQFEVGQCCVVTRRRHSMPKGANGAEPTPTRSRGRPH